LCPGALFFRTAISQVRHAYSFRRRSLDERAARKRTSGNGIAYLCGEAPGENASTYGLLTARPVLLNPTSPAFIVVSRYFTSSASTSSTTQIVPAITYSHVHDKPAVSSRARIAGPMANTEETAPEESSCGTTSGSREST
jgi:hypothetical protein